MTLFAGLSAYPITPCDPDGRVDAVALRRVLAPLVAAGVDGIGLLGSTGTYAYLSRAERRRALEVALGETAIPVVVGIGALRTDEAVRLARDAKAAGAAAGLLALVSYTPLTEDEIVVHVDAVAREGGLPLCLYDNPATTHVALTPALIGRLSRIPGVVAVKSPAPAEPAVAGHLAALREAVPEGISVGCSGDWHAAGALLAGADAWHSVAAGMLPEPCLALVRAARRGDDAEVRRLEATLAPLWALFKEFSSLRVAYAAAEALDLCRTAPPRPILPLPEAARHRVAEVVTRLAAP